MAAISLMAGLFTRSRGEPRLRRTRYRDPVWERPEWIVSGAAVAVLAVEIAVLFLDPAAFRYEPYPSLTAPASVCRCWRRSGCCWFPPRYARERRGLDAARGTNRHLLRADLPVPGARYTRPAGIDLGCPGRVRHRDRALR